MSDGWAWGYIYDDPNVGWFIKKYYSDGDCAVKYFYRKHGVSYTCTNADKFIDFYEDFIPQYEDVIRRQKDQYELDVVKINSLTPSDFM